MTLTTRRRAEDSVIELLGQVRVLPVLSVSDPGAVAPICRALLAGGIPCVEITLRTEAALEAIAQASAIEGLLVGAGTVLDPGQLQAAAQAGAQFALAPGLSEDTVVAARELELPFFPGVATPSEIMRAVELGRSVLKVFPASLLGGPTFLRAVAAPFPGVRFIPTGGVDAQTLRAYLEVPAVLACGGSWLFDPRAVAAGRFESVEQRARQAVQAL